MCNPGSEALSGAEGPRVRSPQPGPSRRADNDDGHLRNRSGARLRSSSARLLPIRTTLPAKAALAVSGLDLMQLNTSEMAYVGRLSSGAAGASRNGGALPGPPAIS